MPEEPHYWESDDFLQIKNACGAGCKQPALHADAVLQTTAEKSRAVVHNTIVGSEKGHLPTHTYT